MLESDHPTYMHHLSHHLPIARRCSVLGLAPRGPGGKRGGGNAPLSSLAGIRSEPATFAPCHRCMPIEWYIDFVVCGHMGTQAF